MRYWGFGVFENDFVGDWVIDLIETDSMNLIEEAIQLALEDAFIEADTASTSEAYQKSVKKQRHYHEHVP
ncbi:hypothetical protein FHS16_005943 [Paenibacillus endophyticus]|uniref:DUF4259 domain-containing protein n=1 Tax=Paenibacillus endophyticus TaxID=1294268 RepID=A0A7W5CDW4_9BACL|nr:hypothetical protein [Paenibacillus endophyticus]